MTTWQGMVRHRPPTEFELLIVSTLGREKKKPTESQETVELPEYLQNIIGDAPAASADYNFECQCYGTKHEIVNSCERCGRVICALEGERPCPHCGSIVLSEATIGKGEEDIAKRKLEITKIIEQNHWMPEIERVKHIEESGPQLVLDGDWFDQELLQIFAS